MAKINAPFRRPIVNHHYGYRFAEREKKGRLHPGEDLNGPGPGASDLGLEVFCIGPGEVTFIDESGPNFGWGKLLYVKHDMKQYFLSYGLEVPEWCPDFVWSQYAHLEEVQVTVGEKVNQETVLGLLGGTPYWSPHLHHEVRKRPLGVYYYPNKRVTKAELEKMYFKPMKFVDDVNLYVIESRTPSRPTSRLIKAEKRPEIYVYNGKERFHIPNEQTALLLFGPMWFEDVEEIKVKDLKAIKESDPIPNMSP